jgi:hypothetical protein
MGCPKRSRQLDQHGAPFAEAVTAFVDPLGRVRFDDRHSVTEPRLVLLGRSSVDRLLAVMFTERGADRVRLISARPATRRERIQYEEASE